MSTRKRAARKRPEQVSLPMNVGDAIAYMRKFRDEVHAELLESGSSAEWATEEANRAWKAILPTLTSRPAVPVYVACVAHGLQRGYLTAEEARTMLYGAQMCLATMPKAGAR